MRYAALLCLFLILSIINIAFAVCIPKCLERDVFDERDPVYLYVVDLYTELDRFCLLTPYDRAYIMTVDTKSQLFHVQIIANQLADFFIIC